MKTYAVPNSRFAATLAAGASATLAVLGTILLVHEQSSESTTVGIEHVSLAGFSLTLFLYAGLTMVLGRLAGLGRIAPIPAVGLVVLGSLAVVSNVRGSDPEFFDAVAGPTNLAWLGGWVAIAVGLVRRRAIPAPLAVGLPLTWALMLPLGPFGGALVASLYWLAMARFFARRSIASA